MRLNKEDFVVIFKAAEEGEILGNISPLKLAGWIKSMMGDVKPIKKLAEGRLMIQYFVCV